MKLICCKLEVPPWQLGVMSSVKGLLAGKMRLFMPEDVVIDCALHADGMLLPHSVVSIERTETDAKFVLLVEKDTVFKKLVQHNVAKHFGTECILLTVSASPICCQSLRESKFSLSADRTGQRLSGHSHSADAEENLGRASAANLRIDRRRSAWHRDHAHLSPRIAGHVQLERCAGRSGRTMDWHFPIRYTEIRHQIDSDDATRSSQTRRSHESTGSEQCRLPRTAVFETHRCEGRNRRAVRVVQ